MKLSTIDQTNRDVDTRLKENHHGTSRKRHHRHLDPRHSHSEIGFTVRHAGISKVRGQFKDAAATLDLAEDVADSKVNAIDQDRKLRLRRCQP